MQKGNSARKSGLEAEERAARYLAGHGMRILARNFYSRQGEIDIIGRHADMLVFVEVKYRRNESAGMPESAVTLKKMKRICRAADRYRYLHHYGDTQPFRYDVVAISGEEIRWYEDAFPHIF